MSVEAKARDVEEALAGATHIPDPGTMPLFGGPAGTAPTACGIYVRRDRIPFHGGWVTCLACLERESVGCP